MKVLLAGRVAEQITFGRVTTGASDDLAKVTTIARSMVYEYGMGTSIRSHQVPANDWNVSEMMRQRRDEEVSEIAEEAYRGAHRLLTDHRDLLDEIARRLLRDEVIEQSEIAAIMAAHDVSVATPEFPEPDEHGAGGAVGNGAPAGLARAQEQDRGIQSRGSEPPPPAGR
jgi:ATP-dependent Zn protease